MTHHLPRTVKQHPWSGVTHHAPNFFSVVWPIAMDRTMLAKLDCFSKATSLGAAGGIVIKVTTNRAELIFVPPILRFVFLSLVVVATIELNHEVGEVLFSFLLALYRLFSFSCPLVIKGPSTGLQDSLPRSIV